RGLPAPWSGLEAVLPARSTVVGVYVVGHDHVAQRGWVPQGSGHTHEEQGGGGELLDGPFGQDSGRLVAFAGESEDHPSTAAGQGADVESGASCVPMCLGGGEPLVHGSVFGGRGGRGHREIVAPRASSCRFGGRGGRMGGRSSWWWSARKRRAGRPLVVRRSGPRGMRKSGTDWTLR